MFCAINNRRYLLTFVAFLGEGIPLPPNTLKSDESKTLL